MRGATAICTFRGFAVSSIRSSALILLAVSGFVAACGATSDAIIPSNENDGGAADSGNRATTGDGGGTGSSSGNGGTDAGQSGCKVDADCTASAPVTTPANCAVGVCDQIAGTCKYHPVDADGDGHYAAGCSGLGVAPGDDCNDLDPNTHPGAWDGPAGLDPAGKTETTACDGVDNDCSGKADDGTLGDGSSCACTVGATQKCSQDAKGNPINYPGGSPAAGSICALGIQTCVSTNGAGQWGDCKGAVLPAARDCTSTADNDCDGKPDNTHDATCQCQPTDPNTCTGGPNNCPGTQTCNLTTASSSWSTCNAPANCTCTNGDTKTCAEVKGAKGTCANGTSMCVGGLWAACSISPAATDTCDKGNDNNCNGLTNEGCSCLNGAQELCAQAPLNAKGSCASGTSTCTNGKFVTCSVVPQARDTCDPGNDATCNGIVNEGCTCINGASESCAAAHGAKGNCATGNSICSNGGWGACSISPAGSDTCAAGDDANCDGTANEGCACTNGSARSCTVGDCGGQQTCGNGQYGGCAQTQAPSGNSGNYPAANGTFVCTADCVKSNAHCVESITQQCGPNGFGTTRETYSDGCPGGYSVTNCSFTRDPSQNGGTVTTDVSGNGCHMHQGTSSGQTSIATLITTCTLN